MRCRRVLLATALLIAGCGGEGGIDASAPFNSVADEAKERAFLAAVGAVDQQLAQDADRVIRAARETCNDLGRGTNRAAVVSSAVSRFGDGQHQLTQEEAELLVSAAERTFC